MGSPLEYAIIIKSKTRYETLLERFNTAGQARFYLARNAAPAAAPDQEAFKERFIVAQAVDYGSGTGGVRVAGAAFGSSEGKLVYSPDNPLPDEGGYVRMPDIDLGTQMTNLLIAQRGYQANISAISRATDAYNAALSLGKNL